MKKNYSFTNCTVPLILLLLAACSKLPLLKDSSLAPIDAGVNLKTQTISQYLLLDHTTDLTSLNLFCDAVKRAGLNDVLNSADNNTVIFLTNDGMAGLLATMGYQSVAAVPPIILKNILSDLIFKGKVKSTDLALNVTNGYGTINGDSLYLTRTSSTISNYVLYVNKSSNLNSPTALVRSQNLEFLNGVAHVTSQYTYYRLIDVKQDDADTTTTGLSTDKLLVTKDVYVQNGSATKDKNFNDPASIDIKNSLGVDITVDRNGLLQFPLTAPSFGSRIGTAKLNVYVYLAGLASDTKYAFSAYLGENKDWNESTVTWSTSPAYNSIAIATQSVAGASVGWVSFDVTASVKQLYANGNQFINVLLNHNVNNFIRLRPREYLSGLYQSYITISSSPVTKLTLGASNPLLVNASTGIATLTVANLQMNGVADKDIIYTMKQVPANGYLVKYGIPIANNAEFSQADITRGVIKYLYSGAGATDQITLEARDNNGGYYLPSLVLNVTIK